MGNLPYEKEVSVRREIHKRRHWHDVSTLAQYQFTGRLCCDWMEFLFPLFYMQRKVCFEGILKRADEYLSTEQWNMMYVRTIKEICTQMYFSVMLFARLPSIKQAADTNIHSHGAKENPTQVDHFPCSLVICEKLIVSCLHKEEPVICFVYS